MVTQTFSIATLPSARLAVQTHCHYLEVPIYVQTEPKNRRTLLEVS